MHAYVYMYVYVDMCMDICLCVSVTNICEAIGVLVLYYFFTTAFLCFTSNRHALTHMHVYIHV